MTLPLITIIIITPSIGYVTRQWRLSIRLITHLVKRTIFTEIGQKILWIYKIENPETYLSLITQ